MATIPERVEKPLASEQNRDPAIAYLEIIRKTMRDCVAAFDRRLTTLIVTAVILELATKAAVSEFSFVGLKFTDLKLLEKLLPIAVAYLYYSLATTITYRRLLSELHSRLMQRLYPDFHAGNFERYEGLPALFETEAILRLETSGRFRSILLALTTPLRLFVGIGPGLYLIYAQLRAFQHFGFKDPLVWIASFATVLFLVLVGMHVEGTYRLTKDRSNNG